MLKLVPIVKDFGFLCQKLTFFYMMDFGESKGLYIISEVGEDESSILEMVAYKLVELVYFVVS